MAFSKARKSELKESLIFGVSASGQNSPFCVAYGQVWLTGRGHSLVTDGDVVQGRC